MLNPLNAPPKGVKMLKSPPRELDEADIDRVVQEIIREEIAAPKLKPRKTLPELAPALPFEPESEEASLGKPRYQPKLRHSAAILALALMIGWPWLLPTFLGLAIILPVVACLVLGRKRIGKVVASGFSRFHQLSPAQAESLRGWAMRRVAGMERMLARLPNRWTAGLYLPDLGPTPESAEKMQQDPFDRLRLDQAEV